jgi:YkoY family integral membrane protein
MRFSSRPSNRQSRQDFRRMFESIGLIADTARDSIFSREAIYVVSSLVLIEGLLSVDNALAIAAMSKHLQPKQRKIAMTVGYAGAYGFRILALLIANVIINNHWLMVLGASYLIWLMCNHFAEEEEEEAEGRDAAYVHPYGFAKTITMIAFLDLSLSFDNVVAAVAFARDNIWLVYLGVTIGIITLRLVAGYCIKLIERFPWLEHTAYILVGFVGILLCVELVWDQWIKTEVRLGAIAIISQIDSGHFHIEKIVKFTGIFFILIANILYETIPQIKFVFRPPLRAIEHVLAFVANVVALIVRVLMSPVRAMRK